MTVKQWFANLITLMVQNFIWIKALVASLHATPGPPLVSYFPLTTVELGADKAVLKSIWIPFLRSGDGIIELVYWNSIFSK